MTESSSRVIIAGHYRVDAAQRDAVVVAFTDLVTRSRQADGCIDCAITADSADEERINMIEIWRDADALDHWRSRANAPDVGVEMRNTQLARYNATDGGPLFS